MRDGSAPPPDVRSGPRAPSPFRNPSRRKLGHMSLTTVLSALYAVAGVAACLCYLPQIQRMRHDVAARRAMSLLAWGGWFGVGGVTVLYAIVVVGQAEMVAVAGLNLLCQGAILGLALRQRLADRGTPVVLEAPPPAREC